MADVQIIDLDPKLSVDGSELLEIQDPAGGPGTSFSTPLSNLIGPQGPQGDPGAPGADGSDGADGQNATADAGTTTTLPAGSNAAVTNAGTTQDAVFDFDIPRGDKGDTGDQGLPGADSTVPGPQGDPGNDGSDGADGLAATIVVGTTTTLAPGVDATVVNVGSSSAAVFDFGIPEGEKGASGAGTGDVVGPDGAVNNNVTVFDGPTGTLIKDGGIAVSDIGLTEADVPIGGTTGQVLSKTSNTNYDLEWTDQSAGGSGNVTGPVGAVANNLATFNGPTGEIIQDGGVSSASFATAAQGTTADSATQPGDNVSTLTNDSGYLDDAAAFATAAQGVLADSAMQPGDNISDLNNNAGYGQGDVTGDTSSVNNRIATFFGTNGTVIQDSGSLVSDFATATQGITADTATQPGDNVSTLTNDAGYKAYYSGAVLPDPAGYAEGDLFMVIT